MKDETLDNGGQGAKKGTATLVAAVIVLIAGLGVAWAWTRSAAVAAEERCAREEEKIDKVKKYLSANWSELFEGSATAPESSLEGGRVLTLVKDLAGECGLAGNVERLDKEESEKLGEVTVKLNLQRVRMADLVNFVALARARFPAITDREGRVQAVRGEQDTWNVTLALTARTKRR